MPINLEAVSAWLNSPYYHHYRKFKVRCFEGTGKVYDRETGYLMNYGPVKLFDDMRNHLGLIAELTSKTRMPTTFAVVLVTFSESTNFVEAFQE